MIMNNIAINTDSYSTTQGTFLVLLLSGLCTDVPTPTSGVPTYISILRDSINLNRSMDIEMVLAMIKDEVGRCGYSFPLASPSIFDKYSDGKDEQLGSILARLTTKEMETVLVELSKDRKRVGAVWRPPLTYPTAIKVDDDGAPTNLRTILQRKKKPNRGGM